MRPKGIRVISLCLAVLLLSGTVHAASFDDEIRFLEESGAQIMWEGAAPFVDENDRTLLPLAQFGRLFGQGITYYAEGDRVWIEKSNPLAFDVVVVDVGSNILYKNDVKYPMDTVPVRLGGEVYLPLRAVADALEYSVYYNESMNSVMLHSNIAEIYIWNEREDSAPEGIRYSVLPGTVRSKELWEIQQTPLTDIQQVTESLSWVEPGEGILTTALYRVRGYKVPYETVYSLITGLFGTVGPLGTASSERCIDEIPPIIAGLNEYTDEWFSKQLYALDEQKLEAYGAHTYRFTWIPSFANPFTVRLEVQEDGSGILHYARCDGPIGADGGELTESWETPVEKDTVDEALGLIAQTGYWNLPEEIDRIGLDGSEWLMEAYRDGKYHIVNRWSPEREDGAAILGQYFMELVEKMRQP